MPRTPQKFRKQRGKKISNNNNNPAKHTHINKYKKSKTTTPKTPQEIKSQIEHQVYSEYAVGFRFLSPKEQIRISKQIEKEVNRRINNYFSRKRKN